MTYGGMYCYPTGKYANPQNTPYSEEVHKNKLYRKDIMESEPSKKF